jgi:hypothetical protein
LIVCDWHPCLSNIDLLKHLPVHPWPGVRP